MVLFIPFDPFTSYTRGAETARQANWDDILKGEQARQQFVRTNVAQATQDPLIYSQTSQFNLAGDQANRQNIMAETQFPGLVESAALNSAIQRETAGQSFDLGLPSEAGRVATNEAFGGLARRGVAADVSQAYGQSFTPDMRASTGQAEADLGAVRPPTTLLEARSRSAQSLAANPQLLGRLTAAVSLAPEQVEAHGQAVQELLRNYPGILEPGERIVMRQGPNGGFTAWVSRVDAAGNELAPEPLENRTRSLLGYVPVQSTTRAGAARTTGQTGVAPGAAVNPAVGAAVGGAVQGAPTPFPTTARPAQTMVPGTVATPGVAQGAVLPPAATDGSAAQIYGLPVPSTQMAPVTPVAPVYPQRTADPTRLPIESPLRQATEEGIARERAQAEEAARLETERRIAEAQRLQEQRVNRINNFNAALPELQALHDAMLRGDFNQIIQEYGRRGQLESLRQRIGPVLDSIANLEQDPALANSPALRGLLGSFEQRRALQRMNTFFLRGQ